MILELMTILRYSYVRINNFKILSSMIFMPFVYNWMEAPRDTSKQIEITKTLLRSSSYP